MTDCATRLTEAKAALHALNMGELVTSITINGQTTTYQQSNIEQLRRYVRELEAECGSLDADGLPMARRGCIRFRG